jgi:hypothetical protein
MEMSDGQQALRWLNARAGTHVRVRIVRVGLAVAIFEGTLDVEPEYADLGGVAYRVGNDAYLVLPEPSGPSNHRMDGDDLVMQLADNVELRVTSEI